MQFPPATPLPPSPPLRWGIAGPGEIADTFASAVLKWGTQQITAVGSRSAQRAANFATRHGIEQHWGSYRELCESSVVDAVYISNHIDGHLELAQVALDAGKHVLVEKPLHYSAQAARSVLAHAKQHQLLMTEAMWTRYLPQSSVLRTIIQSADFGTPEHLVATFAVDNRHIDRLWRPGTGSITYDMGIYPIALAYEVFGAPSRIDALGSVTEGGIDEAATVKLSYPSGATATLVISGIATHPCTATISGQHQTITLEHPFFVPTTMQLATKGLYADTMSWANDTPIKGHEGLYYQAEWFGHYVAQGMTESPVHTHEEILSNLEAAEEIVRLVGGSVRPGHQTAARPTSL